ncbi:hypothetical protein SAMN04488542_10453 [Fontibacillus panacisegetis]|uniref:Uncharacterized protein n=1 Tax=Fontibacillus panacisegetis TaxID=670482 RepID=A0A1G7H8M9_9BACL|nr:hypothetical protein [Fontibacillus panacisegetis]SDE96745.1 hypothetical protein SAMN04488542_10453 [Fontibacillus panacisegetis]
MATKKPLPKKTHFHIPADPLRVRSEEIKARHNSRKENELQSLKASVATNVTNEMLFEMLNDVLERQEILENRLQSIIKLTSNR